MKNIQNYLKVFFTISLLLFAVFLVIGPATAASNLYVNSVSGNDKNDGSILHPKKTIQSAISTIDNGGTIRLANGVYYVPNNPEGNDLKRKGIIITKNINIQGTNRDSTIIDAQKTGRIFTFNAGITGTISTITFKNGLEEQGGAIYNSGKLTIENCKFTGNMATKINGGAVKNGMGNLTLKNCLFTYNSAPLGGAIGNYLGPFNIIQCTFSNNQATDTDGGAIINSQGTGSITQSFFYNNFAPISGAILNSKGTLTVNSSTFTGNKGKKSYAGAIQTYYGQLNLNGCTFTGNSSPQGGAVLNDHGALVICSSQFNSNNASNGYGGAIYNYYSTRFSLNNITFNYNKATKRGAAIHNGNSTLTAYKCTFNGNKSPTGNGGAISTSRSRFTITKSIFKNNAAVRGVSIYNYWGGGTIRSSQIVGYGSQIYSYLGSVDARYNWWGTNKIPVSRLSSGVLYNPWLKAPP